jgi:hypothetical protein
MELKNLNDLGKIADLCRKKGIKTIKISDSSVEFELSPEAPKSNYKKKQMGSDKIDVGVQFTDEEVLLWSSAGIDGESN